ncbi:PDZ domain-containing RING finger protein 4 [Sitophilus oryzae]|uniref:PDZ domain-containing RING finger protein 4 n=1 Tax=Sitophilus oryzae TaxID=7048 RepID=A0A6J2XZL3_SITOR|nr:PDZ domain-containing RING finger protein 4 [Sitophilus oryzae]
MDFIILKVNGTDVSSYPHEDAVRAFLTAQEPIVVEVKRRISGSAIQSRDVSKFVSTACQTDISGIQLIDESAIDCFTHDIDLEEVTLRKCSSDEKLGLTVCYSSGSEVDTCTEVYIRDIAPQSVADRDGRLRQGDQILQVNGKDVANKEETEILFAENRKAVTLLVSRCYNRSEEYLDTEVIESLTSPNGKSAAYQNSIIEQLVQQQAEIQQSPKNETTTPKVPPHFTDKLNLTNSLVRSKIDSINQEISQLDVRMQNISFKSDKRKPPQLPNIPAPPESDTEHIYETIPEDSIIDGEVEPIYSHPYEPGDENMIEQWLKVHQEDTWVAREMLNNEEEEKKEPKKKSKPPKSNSSGEEHENSSSAYNTGGSSNSNPLTFELAATQDAKQKNVYRSTLILCPLEEKEDVTKEKEAKTTCESCKRQVANKAKKSKSSSKIVSPSSPTRQMGLSPAHILSDTMYTNVANLQQTILLQQQLFRQALVAQNSEVVSTRPTTSFTSPSLSQYQFVSGSQSYTTNTIPDKSSVESQMEWKVKRRPDGTRYIARRPVRNRILKNREMKIFEERAGLTTEDDTISELKIGRYWTKEERKKHLEKSRERKQRQEILMASRNIEEVSEEQFKSSSRKAANNLDNTVKKHRSIKSRTHKEKEGHENSVQEVVVHGQKTPPPANGKLIGLLSVTTV